MDEMSGLIVVIIEPRSDEERHSVSLEGACVHLGESADSCGTTCDDARCRTRRGKLSSATRDRLVSVGFFGEKLEPGGVPAVSTTGLAFDKSVVSLQLVLVSKVHELQTLLSSTAR